MSTGSSTGPFFGLKYSGGAWQLSPFDALDNAYSLCTFVSKSIHFFCTFPKKLEVITLILD